MKNTSPNEKNKIKSLKNLTPFNWRKNSRHLSKNNVCSILWTKLYFSPKKLLSN